MNLVKSNFKIKGEVGNKKIISLIRDLGVEIDNTPLSRRSSQEIEWILSDARKAYMDNIINLHTVTNSNSDNEELVKLNVAWNRISKALGPRLNPRGLEIPSSHFDVENSNIDLGQLKNLFGCSKSYNELCRSLKLSISGFYVKGFQEWAAVNEIDCSHFSRKSKKH